MLPILLPRVMHSCRKTLPIFMQLERRRKRAAMLGIIPHEMCIFTCVHFLACLEGWPRLSLLRIWSRHAIEAALSCGSTNSSGYGIEDSQVCLERSLLHEGRCPERTGDQWRLGENAAKGAFSCVQGALGGASTVSFVSFVAAEGEIISLISACRFLKCLRKLLRLVGPVQPKLCPHTRPPRSTLQTRSF